MLVLFVMSAYRMSSHAFSIRDTNGSPGNTHARSFSLTYHRADVSDPLNTVGNAVTAAPVTINLVEGRISLPLRLRERTIQFDIAGRLQDDQPRPDKGFQASVEAAFTVNL